MESSSKQITNLVLIVIIFFGSLKNMNGHQDTGGTFPTQRRGKRVFGVQATMAVAAKRRLRKAKHV